MWRMFDFCCDLIHKFLSRLNFSFHLYPWKEPRLKCHLKFLNSHKNTHRKVYTWVQKSHGLHFKYIVCVFWLTMIDDGDRKKSHWKRFQSAKFEKKSIVYFDAYILEQLLPCLRMNGYKIKHTNNNKRVKPDRPTEIMLLICCVVNSKTLILSQKEVKSVLCQVTSYHVVFTNVYLYHQMNLWNENQQLN